MSRLWGNAAPVTVQTSNGQLDGRPTAFLWVRRRYPIARCLNEWHEVGGWWRFPVDRKVYLVETARGLLAILCHDRVAGDWFLLRVYD